MVGAGGGRGRDGGSMICYCRVECAEAATAAASL